MKLRWRIRDIIDLEYFLSEDDPVHHGAIDHRDREIFLKEVVPITGKTDTVDADRKTIIRLWLEARRQAVQDPEAGETILPGKIFSATLSILTFGLLTAGLMIGSGLAVSLLNYQGFQPVNVWTFFGAFVVFQGILICILAVSTLIRNVVRSLRYTSIVHFILSRLTAGGFRIFATRAMYHFSGEVRNRLASVSGIIKGRKQIYSSVFYRQFFLLIQLVGIGFNLGAIGGSLLKIVGTDLAFGWQSTIQFSSHAVYQFVKTVALPWSSIVPPSLSHPTLAQIEGSRMVLKDGIYHLTTPDLVSWWPFLLFSVLCYGFLPRILLFGAGVIARKKALKKLDFRHAACNRLIRRMTVPGLETYGPGPDQPATNLSGDPDEDKSLTVMKRTMETGRSMIVLIPDDISEEVSEEALKAFAHEHPDMARRLQLKITFDAETDQQALAAQAEPVFLNEHSLVVILQEAWQPPIAETLLYYKKLREILGKRMELWIFLIGKPCADGMVAPVDPSEWKIWKQAVQTLADPFLEITKGQGESG